MLFLSLFVGACDKNNEEGDVKLTTPSSNKKQMDTSQQLGSPDVESPPIPAEEPDIPPTFLEQLSRSALERTTYSIVYDPSYVKLKYPMGDVSPFKGVCTDVIIRSYRQLGVDLQQLVHEDMRANFSSYPSRKLWGHRKPDTNIDHRRVPNLRVFFERKGKALDVTDNPNDYQPGDMVTWSLGVRKPHIGIVAEQVSMSDPQRHLIIHNIGAGAELADMLFDFKITGHYRYQRDIAEVVEN